MIRVTAEDGVGAKVYTMSVSRQSQDKTDHVGLMWSLVAKDDLAGAYWIAKSLADQGAVSAQLPTLLMAAQTARWLTPESRGFVGDLFDIVSETETPFDDDAHVMLALAAAIQPSLIAPETNLFAWLGTPNCLPSLDKIVAPIRKFANLGHPLGPEFVRGDEWHSRLEGLIVDSGSRACEWLQDAEKRRHNLPRANNVWRHLCAKDGILYKLLATVCGDVRVEVTTARSDVNALRQSPFVDELINDTHSSLHPNVKNQIAGSARVWLCLRITEAVDIAAEWCDLVERVNHSESGTRNQWLSERVTEFRSEIAADCEDVLDDIHQISNDESRQDLAAAALCLVNSLYLLLEYLSVEHDAVPPTDPPRVVHDLKRVNRNSAKHGLGDDFDLATALSRRLLWIPEVELLDDGKPSNAESPIDLEMAAPDWFAGDTALDRVTRSRVSSGDFRFLDILSSGTQIDEPSNVCALFPSEISTAKETLRQHRAHSQDVVDQAVSDGVIEFDGKRWDELTNVLEDIVVEHTLNFQRAHDKLDWFERTISDDRDLRRRELIAGWEPLIQDLKNDPSVLGVVIEELDETFRLASHDDSLDIRIMEDCVSRVRNHKSGDGQDLRPSTSGSQSEALENFLPFCENSVEAQSLPAGGNRLRRLLRHADAKQTAEIDRLVNDWGELPQERPHTRMSRASQGRIGRVLKFLGLPYRNDRDITFLNQTPSGNRWLHCILDADPHSVPAIKGAPQFVSLANGKYHVFCLWEDARPDRIFGNHEIKQAAQDSRNAVIVLYLNALTASERRDIRREACELGLNALVIDDVLLAYTAKRLNNRFKALLETTLPFTAANPYNPETLGWGARVAPEMFYGREELARELAARDGTSLVFGGRQLGKTALLRHVEESVSDANLRRFAWFIDLKEMGYVPDAEISKDPFEIYHTLHARFRQDSILGRDASGDTYELMRQDLINAFNIDGDLQVLVMFDESDAFLESDWSSGSAVVESLRALMDNTSNRFKVVFAGLHNVQRFANRPNNPFPNLGFNPNRPRRGGIGPLANHEARNLVEEPSHLLGFRFEPLVVDKILSYTNRHPSLIQFFCHELIRSHRDSNPDGDPPYSIGIEDVDRVYRTSSISEGIKRRFEETFKLDPRYHIMALTMILDQDRPTESWSLGRLRSHCQSYCPATFDQDRLDDIELSSLLNELIGLGVLAEDGKSYRIRSTLIAQMFGSEDEVMRKLFELESDEPY